MAQARLFNITRSLTHWLAPLRRVFHPSPPPPIPQGERGASAPADSAPGALIPGRMPVGFDNADLPAVLPRHARESLRRSGRLDAYLESLRDTFRFQFDAPYRGSADLPILPATEDPLREWNWSTREYVLTNTHAAYQRNPIANRAVKYVASFVVGEGFRLTASHAGVERVLRDFIANPDNAVREYERQAVIDLLVDGELVLRFFAGDDAAAGQVVMVAQRPWELLWIETEPGFFRRPISYRFRRYISAGDASGAGVETRLEDVPAAQILHVAINRHGYELRGRPELYAVLPWLRAYKEWLENRARQNHWRNSLLWHVRVKSSNAATIAAVAARYRKPPTPGSVAVTSDNEEIHAVTNPVGGADAGEDGRQIKLMSAVGMGIPEYFLADGENANMATSSSQELPALTTFADFQRIMVEQVWTPVFRQVIRAAVEAGTLPYLVPEQSLDGSLTGALIPAEEAFTLAYTSPTQPDMRTVADVLDMALRNGLVSRATAAAKLGFDWAAESAQAESMPTP